MRAVGEIAKGDVNRRSQLHVALDDLQLSPQARMSDLDFGGDAHQGPLHAQAPFQADDHQVQEIGDRMPQLGLLPGRSTADPGQRQREQDQADRRPAEQSDPGLHDLLVGQNRAHQHRHEHAQEPADGHQPGVPTFSGRDTEADGSCGR